MRGPKGIIFALRPLGEAGQAAGLPQRPDPVSPTRQNFVGIGLVPDVPDQPVLGCIEHIVDSGGKFDHAQSGPQMPAGHADCIDQFQAQFIGKLAELLRFQLPKFGGRIHRIEQRCPGLACHFGSFRWFRMRNSLIILSQFVRRKQRSVRAPL